MTLNQLGSRSREVGLSLTCGSIALLALVWAPAGAQRSAALPVVTLKAGEEHPEPFTFVSGVQELPDGRLIVADPREQAIRLLDFRDGSMRQVGRRGRGPGEYASPRNVLPWFGDTVLVYDVGNRRVHKIDGAGRLAGVIAMPPEFFLNRGVTPPEATDTDGHLYLQVEPLRLLRRGPVAITHAVVVRWRPGGAVLDTVATVMVREPQRATVHTAYFPFQDGWAVRPDGTVGVARAVGYHVEWIRRGAAVVRGPAISYRPVRVTKDEREAHAARRAAMPPAGAAINSPERSDGSASRRIRVPDEEEERYPDVKPPFEARDPVGRRAVHLSPSGELWVTRSSAWNDQGPRIDVFDGSGRLTRQVVLPARSRVVGFGRGVVYVVRRDADDLEWLQRLPL